ncbi:hypothetical protein DFJ73DRAFT_926750 [Zopfochytrium polystomum]|nr:hypothetical protein DFJ73DRAFT_926750 [Zopfochytrium polystomum]
MVHLDYPPSQSQQQLQQPASSAASADLSASASSPSSFSSSSAARSPVEVPSATYPPSTPLLYPPDASRPISFSTSNATGSTASPPAGTTTFYTFPPDSAELKKLEAAQQKKKGELRVFVGTEDQAAFVVGGVSRIAQTAYVVLKLTIKNNRLQGVPRLWLFLIVAASVVVAAIIVGVAVAVTNSNKSNAPDPVTLTTTQGANQSSSSSSSSKASNSSPSPSLLTQSTTSTPGTAAASQETGQQTTDQPTRQPTTAQQTTTTSQQPTTTTTTTTATTPKSTGFQIRLSGSSQCVAGSSFQSCEASPGASSPQVFVDSGPNWKQVSSGMCLTTFHGLTLSLDPCNSSTQYQIITYDGTIQTFEGEICVKSDLSLQITVSGNVNPADCGKFDRVSLS